MARKKQDQETEKPENAEVVASSEEDFDDFGDTEGENAGNAPKVGPEQSQADRADMHDGEIRGSEPDKVGGVEVERFTGNETVNMKQFAEREFIVARKRVGAFTYGQRIKESQLPRGADVDKLVSAGFLSLVTS